MLAVYNFRHSNGQPSALVTLERSLRRQAILIDRDRRLAAARENYEREVAAIEEKLTQAQFEIDVINFLTRDRGRYNRSREPYLESLLRLEGLTHRAEKMRSAAEKRRHRRPRANKE